MLTRILEYADSRGIVSETGFTSKTVRWMIHLDDQGRFLGIVEQGDVTLKKNQGKRYKKCPDMSASELASGGASNPMCHFLVESAEVVLSWTDNLRTQLKHMDFVAKIEDAARDVPYLSAISSALLNCETRQLIIDRVMSHKIKPIDKISFIVGNTFVLDDNAWHTWWRGFRKSKGFSGSDASDSSEDARAVDFTSGNLIVPVSTHPKIVGLSAVGGYGPGDALICFDKDAFSSYGLERGYNCPVSAKNATAYRDAIHDLIHNHSKRLSNTLVLYWYSRDLPREEDALSWLSEPDDQQLAMQAEQRASVLLDAISKGSRPDLYQSLYYAMTLSGASGRVMIRDWNEGPFVRLLTAVQSWFSNLSIVHRDGGQLAPLPKFTAILGCCFRDLKDIPRPFEAAVWHAAITNQSIPYQAMALATRRVLVDMVDTEQLPPNHARMGLIKAYHLRKMRTNREEACMSAYLNETHPSPAYQCGRLMAVLAQLQYSALGDVGAGVVQRYYAAASATPALVLGRLLRGAQFHLNKLEGGLPHYYERHIGQIMAQLGDSIPGTLSLEEQSLFALGYYQQKAHDRTRSTDHSAKTKEETE